MKSLYCLKLKMELKNMLDSKYQIILYAFRNIAFKKTTARVCFVHHRSEAQHFLSAVLGTLSTSLKENIQFLMSRWIEVNLTEHLWVWEEK